MIAWIISISVSTLITSILITLLPEKESINIVKFVMSLVVILVIITPLTNNEFYLNLNLKNESANCVEIQNNFIDYYSSKKIEYIKNYCNIICNEEGFNQANVILDYEEEEGVLNVKKIMIYLTTSDNISNEERIKISDRIIKGIKKEYNVDVTVEYRL